jgi:hypothetical protein
LKYYKAVKKISNIPREREESGLDGEMAEVRGM